MNFFAWAGVLAGLVSSTLQTADSGQTLTKPPITHILAIGRIRPEADLAAVHEILPSEMRETLKLYLAGKIDQWYSLADGKGVVFLLNVTDLAEAHAMLEGLPLGQAHLMEFELSRLAPLQPAKQLLPS